MADIGTLNPEQMLQQQQILRQQKMAEMLMQQGMQQPQGQMVSGRYVAPSIFQNLAGLANVYMGQRGIERAEQAQLDLAKAIREQGASEVADIINTYQGRPAKPAPAGYELVDAGTPAVAPNPQKALAQATVAGPYGRALLPAIMKNALPEPIKPTTDMQNFEFAKNQGFKGSFTDFKNQITPYQQAQLNFDREKFEFEKNKAAIKPLPEGLNKQVTGAVNLTDAISDYQNKIKGFGVKDFANPDKRAEMGNLYNNMMLQAKEAYNLGVLNGPDYDILQKVVKDPTNVTSLAFTNNALSKQADSLRKTASDIVKNAYMSQGREVPVDISMKFVKKEEPKTEKKSVKEQLGLSKAPKGVDPKVWNVMTPEEKDLFK